jgi:sulfite oxidase
MWVTYGAGVYDITDFVASHPGGAAKILLGVGKDLGAFWNLFPFHREKPNVLAQLEAYRIASCPISNREFLAFVQDEGYRNPDWWAPADFIALTQTGRCAPRRWR